MSKKCSFIVNEKIVIAIIHIWFELSAFKKNILRNKNCKKLLKNQKFGQNGNISTSASKNTAKGERMR